MPECCYSWKDKKQHILIPVFVLLAVLLALLHDRSHMLVSLLAAGIAVALVFSNKLVFREKTQKWIDRLDEHTYTIYLVHGVVFCSLIDRLKPLGVPSVIIGGIAILLTTVGTILVHKWIEKPIQTLLRKELLHHST